MCKVALAKLAGQTDRQRTAVRGAEGGVNLFRTANCGYPFISLSECGPTAVAGS